MSAKPDSALPFMANLIDEWTAARRALAEVERAEHPDITDRHGRVWIWKGHGDLYTHDETLACPMAWIAELGLPPVTLATNRNYSELCHICRSEWGGAS